MKICYVASDVVVPYPRGASTHVYEVASNLAEKEHEVHVVSRRLNRNQPQTEHIGSFVVHRYFTGIVFPAPISTYGSRLDDRQVLGSGIMKNIYSLYLLSLHAMYVGTQASRIIRKEGLEIILERETSFGAGAVASLMTGKPLVLEIIAPRYSPFSLRAAHIVITYSKSFLKNKVASEKVRIVSAAANTRLFRPDRRNGQSIREKYGLDSHPIIGYVGSFSSWHGVNDLIYASPRIVKRHPNVKFVMVGPYFEQAKSLSEALGVREYFVFTGPVAYENVPAFINAMDIMVAPYNPAGSKMRSSCGLGSPLKLFEYMACRKPVVGTSVEPVSSLVKDGVNGLLAKPGDSKDLAGKILRLLDDEALAERLAHAGEQMVLERYSWKAFAEDLASILKDALDGYA